MSQRLDPEYEALTLERSEHYDKIRNLLSQHEGGEKLLKSYMDTLFDIEEHDNKAAYNLGLSTSFNLKLHSPTLDKNAVFAAGNIEDENYKESVDTFIMSLMEDICIELKANNEYSDLIQNRIQLAQTLKDDLSDNHFKVFDDYCKTSYEINRMEMEASIRYTFKKSLSLLK